MPLRNRNGRRAVLMGALLVALAGLAGVPTPKAASPSPSPSVFVSTVGRDSNPCTQAAPCRSFARAYQAASPGSVVAVAPGTYPSQTILVDSSKTSPADVVFESSGATISGDLTLGTTSGCNGSQHITFRDLRVTGEPVTRCGTGDITFDAIDASGINLGGGFGLTVLGGDFGPNLNGISEIKNGATNVVIDGATFHDFLIDDPAQHSECLMIWGGGVSNVTIRNSTFRNCTDFDILVKPASNVTIENSFFDEPMPGNVATTSCNPNCPRDGNAIALSSGSGIVVRYSSVLGGIRVDPEVSNVVVKGNVGEKGRGSCQPNATFSYNVWSAARCSPTDRTAPLSNVFVNPVPPALDLRLKADSPALGAGDPADHPARDIAGRLRPTGFAPDAGAWQREPALVVPGRAIGTARIAMPQANVIAFYGGKRQHSTEKLPNGAKIAVDTYRVRGGKLRVSYRDNTVVAIGTTTPFYRTAKGFAVGAPLPPRGTDWTCRPVGAPRGKARTYVRPTHSAKRPVVAELIVVARHFTPLCALLPKSR